MNMIHLTERVAGRQESDRLRELFRDHYCLQEAPVMGRIRRFYKDTGELVEYDTSFEMPSGYRYVIREFLESGRAVYCEVGDKKFISAPLKSAYAKAEEYVLAAYKKEMGW